MILKSMNPVHYNINPNVEFLKKKRACHDDKEHC